MGDEIEFSRFRKKDYERFFDKLDQETELLRSWLDKGQLSTKYGIAGFEQEAWLIDNEFSPSPANDFLLNDLKNALLSPELSRFNIELNVNPQTLGGDCFSHLRNELVQLWQSCERSAQKIDAHMMMTGILPTVCDHNLTIENMSPLNRYRALNEQIMQARKGKPLKLDIVGESHLQSRHTDVMLESAATSFQIHRQIPFPLARRAYNASIIASAPLVALSANSPYLFGTDLWDETRIPVFEQAVAVGGYGLAMRGPTRRVSFGTGYAQHSLLECFIENREHFPVLLPVEFGEAPERLCHLRLHNGTIWRWNRPLIGFDDDGTPHLRIEQRVVPAGPTVIDEIANAVFFYGLHENLMTREIPPELKLSFSDARDNFYLAAQKGLRSTVLNFDGKKVPMKSLILEELMPAARDGLEKLAINRNDIKDYLGIIEARVSSGRNGACWQRSFVAENGNDMRALTSVYYHNQQCGNPVHEWSI